MINYIENCTTVAETYTEGRFFIVKYGTMDGDKEKVFETEQEAQEFIKTL